MSSQCYRRERIGLLLLIGFVFFVSIDADAQVSGIPDSASQTGLGGQNAIEGTVFGPSGRPVETRVRIRLSSMTAGDRTTTTNENGSYAFRGLPNGGYTVAIDREKQYEPVSHNVDVMQFRGSPPQTYRLNISLVLKASAESKPSVISAELAEAPQPAQDLYKKAVELIKTGDRKGGIENLKLAIEQYPKFALAYLEMGVQHMRLNDLENAAEAFRIALTIKPESFDAQMNLGAVYFFQKKFAEAETSLRSAAKLQPATPGVRYYLGMSIANLGKFDEAEKELQAAIKGGGPEMKEAHRILAIIYGSRGENKRALNELEAYVKLAPNAPDIEKLKERIAQLRRQD